MKKLYILLFTILITSVSFGQIWFEDFEAYTDGTGIDGSVGATVTNIGDYPGSVSKWTLDATGAALTASSDWAKTVSGIFSFRDIDGPLIWQSELIDISSAVNPVSFELVASNNAGGFETSDFYDVFYSIDGGGFTLIQNWNSLGDTSHTIIGEVGSVDWNSIENIQVTGLAGSTLQIRVQAVNNSGAEEFFLDNIQVFDGNPPPAISINSPADMAILSPGTTSINIDFTAVNLGGGDQVDITVTKNAGMPTTTNDVMSSPFVIMGATDGDAYEVTAEIVNGMTQIDFETINFTIGSATQVADIATLIADVGTNGVGGFYEITGAVLVTHTDGFNDRQWIQDSNISGILIYDSAGVIATAYTVGDNVTGLKGTTTTSSGVLRFVPTEDSGVVASSGNAVTPQVVTIAAFNATPDDYESELIRINDVTFVDGDGMATFATGTNYDVTDGVDTVVKRTDFFGADYIGELIPTGQITGIVGVAGEFNGTAQIYVRNLLDLTLATDGFDLDKFAVYPNPTSLGYVNISSKNGETINANVFDILGKQVINTTVSNNRLDVSNLNTGVYIMRITQNNATITKKLVIN